MTLTRADLTKLAVPLATALALIAGGAALVWLGAQTLKGAERVLASAQAERKQANERLARIAEEEREVNQKLAVYLQLKNLNVLGEERRLEWAEAIRRIRAQRELLDLSYRIEKQKLMLSAPGKPAAVEFFASTMKVVLALLHEEDLVRFLADLRSSGNAYYSVRKCAISRTGLAATGGSITPRLRAECEIDLITIIDRGAKQ